MDSILAALFVVVCEPAGIGQDQGRISMPSQRTNFVAYLRTHVSILTIAKLWFAY